MREMLLHGLKAAGRVALVNDEDWDLVTPHRWRIWEKPEGPAGQRPKGPYARTLIEDRTVYMHILIMGQPGIDHINHNGLDNQRHNLRPATVRQNGANQRPRVNAASPFKGVTWDRRLGKWKAVISIGGKSKHIGVFSTDAEAAAARDAVAAQVQGSFAYLNWKAGRL